jgi:hypothetical protein
MMERMATVTAFSEPLCPHLQSRDTKAQLVCDDTVNVG